MYWSIFIFILFCSFDSLSEGLAQGTLVKTEHGYKRIETIRKGETIVSHDTKNKKRKTCKVEEVYQSRVPYVIRLFFSQYDIDCAPDQKIYISSLNEYRYVEDLVKNSYLFKLFSQQTGLIHCAYVSEPRDVYIFTSKKYHNFFITYQDILVHNFEPLFTSSFLVTQTTVPFVCEGGVTALASGNVWIAAAFFVVGGICYCVDKYILKASKKNKAKQVRKELERERQRQIELERKRASAGFGGPQKDPDDEDKKKKETTEERKERLRTNQSNLKITEQERIWFEDKEDFIKVSPEIRRELIYREKNIGRQKQLVEREALKGMEFEVANDFHFNSKNQEVYKKKSILITFDLDSHKGGFWKVYRRGIKDRLGTFSIDLKTRVGD